MGKDGSTRAEISIGYEHHEIHGGSHFFYQNFLELDDAGVINFGIQTPDTPKETHIVWEIQAQGLFTFEVFEGSTITFGGTDLVAINNDRNSATTSTWIKFQSNPTITVDGTAIARSQVGDSTNPVQRVPGGGDRDREIILARDTNYTFRITSGVDGNAISYLAEWYEHTRKS